MKMYLVDKAAVINLKEIVYMNKRTYKLDNTPFAVFVQFRSDEEVCWYYKTEEERDALWNKICERLEE